MIKAYFLLIFFAFLCISSLCYGIPLNNYSKEDKTTLYQRLDPKSIREHLTFYNLYPNSPEGKTSLEHARNLLAPKNGSDIKITSSLKDMEGLSAIIDLIINNSSETFGSLNIQDIEAVKNVASHLLNRNLAGYKAKSEEEVLKLSAEEIDLGRSLLLNQFKNSENSQELIESYEAALDFMAMQVLPYANFDASPEKKIHEINRFIFEILEFRFPPHSLWAENIDTYTFLPSVLDSRRGVCLGVSILYLCIAQRLGLDLEIITPPGHIYLRHRSDEKTINIETTARGIHMPSENYLSINTFDYKIRNTKEVIGFARFNQASVYWQRNEYAKAIYAYKEASKYVPNDPLILEFLGYNLLLSNKVIEGRKTLKASKALALGDCIYRDPLMDDYFHEKTDIEGISIIYMPVDDTKKSILKKQSLLLKKLTKYPNFQTGIFHLAITYFQLGETKNAMKALERYHKLNPNNPTVEYYLSELKLNRFDLPDAWKHYKYASEILKKKNHRPRALKNLHLQLLQFSSEPK